MTLDRINKEQGLYVFPNGRGYSHLGFDVAARHARSYAEITGKTYDYQAIAHGSLRGLREYERAAAEARAAHEDTGARATGELTPQLVGLEGKRVEIVDKYGERRRFIVGRSTGWLPVHLEIHNVRSSGGGAVTGAPFRSVRVVGPGRSR